MKALGDGEPREGESGGVIGGGLALIKDKLLVRCFTHIISAKPYHRPVK